MRVESIHQRVSKDRFAHMRSMQQGAAQRPKYEIEPFLKSDPDTESDFYECFSHDYHTIQEFNVLFVWKEDEVGTDRGSVSASLNNALSTAT